MEIPIYGAHRSHAGRALACFNRLVIILIVKEVVVDLHVRWGAVWHSCSNYVKRMTGDALNANRKYDLERLGSRARNGEILPQTTLNKTRATQLSDGRSGELYAR